MSARSVTSRIRQYSNEEAITGALFTAAAGSIHADGWDATLEFVEFSKQTKEPDTGADVAIVIDVIRGSRRALKTIWLQAKKAETRDVNLCSLADLSGQLQDMRRHTKESFGLLYTPQGIVLASDDNRLVSRPTLDRCRRSRKSVDSQS